MHVYIILAHPEPKSFNSALAITQRDSLKKFGHKVRFKNLYKDNFNPLLSRNDFPEKIHDEHIQFPLAQSEAAIYKNIVKEISNEQNNLLWADTVILQFPLWLYGMPAILKGWCERVLSEGFAHQPKKNKWFENGGMSNTRLLLSITTNGKKETFSSRGRHGSIDIILWPILNSLWFSGFQIVKPFISYDVVRASDNQRKEILEKASKNALKIDKSPLLPVHSLTDYEKNGMLKTEIKSFTAGQQKPDNLLENN